MRLNDVLHVPVLRRKLNSLSAATRNGCSGTFKGDNLDFFDANGSRILSSTKINNLYCAKVDKSDHDPIQDSDEEADEGYVAELDEITLWHQRMGHVNDKYLLNTAKAVIGLDKLINVKISPKQVGETVKCIGCSYGKQAKKPTPSRTTDQATEIGQRLHLDIGGPVGTTAIGNYKYYILYKDEFTTYMFIDSMESRSEAFDSIRRVVANINAATTTIVGLNSRQTKLKIISWTKV